MIEKGEEDNTNKSDSIMTDENIPSFAEEWKEMKENIALVINENKRLRLDNSMLKGDNKNLRESIKRINNLLFPNDENHDMSTASNSLHDDTDQNENSLSDESEFIEALANMRRSFRNQSKRSVTFQDDESYGPYSFLNPHITSIVGLHKHNQKLQRVDGRGRERVVYNTQTIHIHSISAVYLSASNPKSKRKRAWSWMMAFASLFCLMVQLLLVQPLSIESISPTCAKHNDCHPGQLCNGFKGEYFENDLWRQPRCESCDLLNEWVTECTELISLYDLEMEQYIDTVWFASDYTAYVDAPEFFQSNSAKDLFIRCVSIYYCQETKPAGMSELLPSTCPHLRQRMEKLSNEQILVFFAVSILFAAYLVDDIKQAAVEDKLLDFVIETSKESVSYSAYGIRIANRMRRYMLPWMNAIAAASILLSESLSAQNILLNLIAILFISETDDLLGALFLTSAQHSITDDLVFAANKKEIEPISNFGTQGYGIFVSIVMFASSLSLEPIMNTFYPELNCAGIDYAFKIIFLFICPSLVLIFWTCRFLFFEKQIQKKAQNLLELSRIFNGIIMATVHYGLLEFAMDKNALEKFTLVPFGVDIVATAYAGTRIHHYIQNMEKQRSRGDVIIDILISLSWIGIQIWAFTSLITANFHFHF